MFEKIIMNKSDFTLSINGVLITKKIVIVAKTEIEIEVLDPNKYIKAANMDSMELDNNFLFFLLNVKIKPNINHRVKILDIPEDLGTD